MSEGQGCTSRWSNSSFQTHHRIRVRLETSDEPSCLSSSFPPHPNCSLPYRCTWSWPLIHPCLRQCLWGCQRRGLCRTDLAQGMGLAPCCSDVLPTFLPGPLWVFGKTDSSTSLISSPEAQRESSVNLPTTQSLSPHYWTSLGEQEELIRSIGATFQHSTILTAWHLLHPWVP